MVNSAQRKPMVGIENYLLAEDESPQRHEYVAGGVFAMAGGSELGGLDQLVLPCGPRTAGLALDDVYEDVEGLAR